MAIVPNKEYFPDGYPKFICKGFAQRLREYEKEDRAKKREEEKARNSTISMKPIEDKSDERSRKKWMHYLPRYGHD